MRTEFVYSFMALGAIPVVANAADVQTISSDVLASTDGSQVAYTVGKLVPGSYAFKAKLTSKVYNVTVKIGGVTQVITNGTNQDVEIPFDLTEETDIELTLVSSDPGEPGAGFTVADAVVELDFNFATIKSTLASNAEALAAIIGGYNYAAKAEDVDAANALKTKAQGVAESYDDYKKFKLYATKSTIQEEIDALAAAAAAKEAAYQNEQAYNRVNAAITAIKAKYNTAVSELEETLVGVAAYLLDDAKADLNEHINVKITEATQASYASYQAGTAVADEATNTAAVPTEGTLNTIVNNWKGQATTNINAYNTLHAKVTALQGQLNAIAPAEAIASQFTAEKAEAQAAINAVNDKVEAAKNSAAQLTLNVDTEEAAAQTKINTLAGKVTTANNEYNANQATLAAIATLQTNLNNAKAAVNALKSADGLYEAKNYYDAYVANIQTEIDNRTAAAKKAYEEDHNAATYDVKAAPVQALIDAYAGTTEPAVDGMPKQAVAKYDALQTAMATYKTQLDAARAQVEGLAVYNDDKYDYQTRFDLIQKRINDIKKAITAAQGKVGAEHWTAMLAIDADAAITSDIATLVASVQSDQNQYDADVLANGLTTLNGKITAFNANAANDAVYGDDFAAFAAVEAGIEAAYNAVNTAQGAIDANSETVNYTKEVDRTWGGSGTAGAWASPHVTVETDPVTTDVAMCENYNTGSCQVTGVIISQTINVENGIYEVQLYANANHANGVDNSHAINADATDVAYVFANGVEVPVTAKNQNTNSVNGEYTISNVVVKDGKLTIGIGKYKAGTNWHTIQIKSLKANTASLIQNWGAKVTDLNKQQESLESVANAVAAKVTANTTAKTSLGTSIDGLQTAMGTFETTYKVGQDDSSLGNRGKAPEGSVYKEMTAINTALTMLETNNNNVDVTVVTNVDKTSAVGTTNNDWVSGDIANIGSNNLTVNGMHVPEQWHNGASVISATGTVLVQTVKDLPNGIYDIELYAFAAQGSATPDDATAVEVFANDKTAPVAVSAKKGDGNWPGNASELVAAGGFKTCQINGVIVSDGTLKMGITKLKGGSQWHGIQIKSLTYHENTNPALAEYSTAYTELAARKNELDEAAPGIVAEVKANADTNTAATTAVTNLQTAELNTLKSLTNVTDASAVSTDAVAKKADPAEWKVFETGLDADKSYTAKKAAIDADITALSAAIATSTAEETLASKWKDNSITVGTGDEAKTYSIAALTDAINALKAEAEAESANYEAYKALQDNNMAKLLPDTITGDASVFGAGAEAYYTGLKAQYITDKAAILTRMQADLNARKAVSTKSAFEEEIAALIAKVKVVKSDGIANKKKYDEQKTAYTETQTLWNSTYTEIAATDHSSKVQDYLDELDAIQVTLTAATEAVETNYPLGKSVAEAKDFAAIKAAINDVKARQEASYSEFVAADNKAAHESFMGTETTKGAIQMATEAYQKAVQERATYSVTNEAIKDAVDAAAATLDKLLYDCPTDIENLTKAENAAYEATVSPTVFDVNPFNTQATTIEANITTALATFKADVKTAIQTNVWNPKKTTYNTKVTAAETAIAAYSDAAKADAFKDVKDLIADGDAALAAVNLAGVEAAINALENIDAMLIADLNVAADKDITAKIAAAEAKYTEVKTYINGVTIADDVYTTKATQLEALEKAYDDGDDSDLDVAYAKTLAKTFANRDEAAGILDGFITTAEGCKTAVEAAVTNDVANTAAYGEMTAAIAPVEAKLAEAKAAAAPYKYATSFATDEANLAGIQDDADFYKATGYAVAYKATVLGNVATLSTNIEATLTTAFGTEKTGLSADITELKNQYNAYVAANGLDDQATAFKTAIDALEAQVGSIAIVDADDPADGIQYDEILAATDALVKLQNDIADKETELLAANASGANADVLADFNTQLDDLAAAASLDGNDAWVGEQIVGGIGGKKIYESIAEISAQIADLKSAIEAEANISFYKDQYQAQIDAIENALAPVSAAITAKQAQFTANATAYATLSAKLNELQGKVDAAKEKVGAYEYAGVNYDYTYLIEQDWDDDGVLDDGIQKDINDTKADIEALNAAVDLPAYYTLGTLEADVDNTVQQYLDDSANKELMCQKNALDTDLTNAIDVKYKAQKYSSRLWARLIAEKSNISGEITELHKDIWYSYIAKPRSCDADYAAQMETVAAIKAKIAALANAVDDLALLGDANEDGKVNVLDYQKVLNMILDPSLQPEEDSDLFANIDINQTSVIEVGDLTAIVQYILKGDWQGFAAARGMVAESNESLSMNVSSLEQGKQRIAVSLANVSDYTAFQMDVVLPEGMKIVGTSLSDRAGESHKLYSRAQMDGSFRLVASSVKGETFSGNEGAVLYIDVEGAGNIELLNILFSDVNTNTRSFSIGGNATGIDMASTFEALKQKVYDLGGRVKNGLKRGINIIRKADGSSQKVIEK